MTTYSAPNVPLEHFKRTKIIATVGPASNSYESVLSMLKAGANGFRLNFSHGTYEERDQQIKYIRKASNEYGKPAAIIQDLQGPKIRLGDFEGFIGIQPGQSFTLKYKGEYEEGGPIPVQYDLTKKVKRGERLLVNDGKLHTIVTSVQGGLIHVRAENEGILTKRKGINVPDTDFGGDIITKKDKKDIVYGAHQDIDYVALSFVQTADDIKKLRRMLKNNNSPARIIAKIETQAAIDNLEEIVQEADAVMVARGDLATETAPENVPLVQREIVGMCRHYGKSSIVATQMLASMTDQLSPTRAEVSDVATAVIIGSDSVMLSEETANGKYPVEVVRMMKRIIVHTQINAPLKPVFFKEEDPSVQSALSSAVITLAHQVGAKAIVSETKSGNTARSIAAHRPSIPLIVVTSNNRVSQQMAIVYGTKSYVRPDSKTAAIKLTDWLRHSDVFKKDDIVVISSGKYPGKIGGTDTIKVRKLE